MDSSYCKVLRQTFQVAQQIKACAVPVNIPDPSPPSQGAHIPELRLRPPRDITTLLGRRGLLPELIRNVSTVYERGAHNLRVRIEAGHRLLCDRLATTSDDPRLLPIPLLFDRVRTIHERMHERAMKRLTETILASYGKADQQHHSRGKASRPNKNSFNHEFVPLFEEYYLTNRYPSHAKKDAFAKESGMTFQQINDWFQNRRNRDGDNPKKQPSCGNSELTTKSFAEWMGGRTDPELEHGRLIKLNAREHDREKVSDPKVNERITSVSSQDASSSSTLDILSKGSPPHAFPSVYPSLCSYDPFPTRQGKRIFPTPTWIRTPAKSVDQPPLPDLDSLALKFSQMRIRDCSKRRLVAMESEDDDNPVKVKLSPSSALSFATRVPPAPLPALTRSGRPTFHPCLTLSVPPPSRFPGASLPTPPAQFSAHAHSSKRRKITPLSRRSPSSTVFAPSSPSSRSSSSTSNSCEFSTSSPSSTITTPECLSTSLPDVALPPVFNDVAGSDTITSHQHTPSTTADPELVYDLGRQ